MDRLRQSLPLPLETLAELSAKATVEFQGLVALRGDYERPGAAYRHTQGMLQNYLKRLEEDILAGAVDKETGEDLTPYLRAQRLVALYVLALPATIENNLRVFEDKIESSPPLPEETGREQLAASEDEWPVFD